MYVIDCTTAKLLQDPQMYREKIFHANTPACNGHCANDILLCWKSQMSITLASVIRCTRHPCLTPKSALTYTSPEYYDHFLSHNKKPHLSHRTGGNFPLHMKQLNAGASGRYCNNIFTLDLMTNNSFWCLTWTYNSRKFRRLWEYPLQQSKRDNLKAPTQRLKQKYKKINKQPNKLFSCVVGGILYLNMTSLWAACLRHLS